MIAVCYDETRERARGSGVGGERERGEERGGEGRGGEREREGGEFRSNRNRPGEMPYRNRSPRISLPFLPSRHTCETRPWKRAESLGYWIIYGSLNQSAGPIVFNRTGSFPSFKKIIDFYH